MIGTKILIMDQNISDGSTRIMKKYGAGYMMFVKNSRRQPQRKRRSCGVFAAEMLKEAF